MLANAAEAENFENFKRMESFVSEALFDFKTTAIFNVLNLHLLSLNTNSNNNELNFTKPHRFIERIINLSPHKNLKNSEQF